MSDTQRDREERQHVIEVLKSWDGYFIGYTSDEVQEALRYAIASIETDLRYDLLYEETSGQADKPTPKMTNGQIYIGSMSHETAIGILKLMLEAMEVYDSISPTLERVNAVKMGIEALEQESNCLKIPTGSTTKDYLGVDCISRRAVIEEMEKRHAKGDYITKGFISSLPSVTPQLSSGLEKNSKKLEKDFGESDCISRSDVLKLMQDNWHTHNGDWAMQESMDDIRALPAVTPQEPRKGHWIEHPRTKELRFHHIYECSACKTQIIGNRYNVGNYKYCPHCGIEFEVEE